MKRNQLLIAILTASAIAFFLPALGYLLVDYRGRHNLLTRNEMAWLISVPGLAFALLAVIDWMTTGMTSNWAALLVVLLYWLGLWIMYQKLTQAGSAACPSVQEAKAQGH